MATTKSAKSPVHAKPQEEPPQLGQQPMFQGNPFSFKGLSKPAGMLSSAALAQDPTPFSGPAQGSDSKTG